MAVTFNTDKDTITGYTGNGTFQDVDLSSYIPAGSTGVILDIETTSTSNQQVDIRKNGSSDTNAIRATLNNADGYNQHTQISVGVDSSRIIEINTATGSVLTFSVVGWFDYGAVFFTNSSSKSTTTTDAWVDVDCTTDFGTDTGNVEVAIVHAYHASTDAKYIKLRKNGETHAGTNIITAANYAGKTVIVPVDSNDIFEQYQDDASFNFYLVGYIKQDENFVGVADPSSTESADTLSAWTDLDLTAKTSTSTVGAFISCGESTKADSVTEVRENGSTNSNSNAGMYDNVIKFVGLDSSQIIEYYVESTSTLAVLGYEEWEGTPYADKQIFSLGKPKVSDDEQPYFVLGKPYYVIDGTGGTPPTGGSKINIGDDFKEIASVSINIGDSWKPVTSIKLNVGDSWKDVNI